MSLKRIAALDNRENVENRKRTTVDKYKNYCEYSSHNKTIDKNLKLFDTLDNIP